jgi:hypothetical protein
MKASPQTSSAVARRTAAVDIVVLDDDNDFVHYIEDFLKD